ncbi:MAG: hypothetical protein Salg2KO_18190 [Salibacteraceae bacterium]
MIVERYGIQLKSLDKKHLQDLRAWRNRPDTRNYLEFQEHIDEREQEEWYARMDHTTNLLFTYHQNGKVQGFVQLKNIDLTRGTAEAGIIHGNEETRDSPVAIIAILVLMELAFDVLGMERLRAKIKHDNATVIAMNQQLGYEKSEIQSDPKFPYYEVSKSRFSSQTKRFRTMLAKRHGKEFSIKTTDSDAYWLRFFQSKATNEFFDSVAIISNV